MISDEQLHYFSLFPPPKSLSFKSFPWSHLLYMKRKNKEEKRKATTLITPWNVYTN